VSATVVDPPILSQDEIDALMAAEGRGELGGGTSAPASAAGPVAACDVTQQDRIIRGRLTALEMASQRFARHYQASLSGSLRQAFDVTHESPRLMKFGEYMGYVPNPSCISVIELAPLRGRGLLVVEPELAWGLIDLFFGASAPSRKERAANADFTSVERQVVRRIVGLTLKDVTRAWRGVYPLQPTFVLTESNPQYVMVIDSGDVVINSAWEVRSEHLQGRVNLLVPYASVEPIKDQLAGHLHLDESGDDSWRARLHREMSNTDVDVRVELGRCQMRLRDVMALRRGQFIALDRGPADALELLVESVPKFAVVPLANERDVAVRLVGPIDPAERRARRGNGSAAARPAEAGS
jgi:flagellar motor switch protein FliM